MSLSTPPPSLAQPLGEGEMLVFSLMRLNVLRPFELYLLDHANGIRSISQGLVRSDINPVWSPDGAHLLVESVFGRRQRYYLANADGSNRREIAPDRRSKALPRWSPDGSRLAHLAYDQPPAGSVPSAVDLCVIHLPTGNTPCVATGNVQDLAWTPDGQSLLAVVRTGDTLAVDIYSPHAVHERHLSEADYLRDAVYAVIAPDATLVAYVVPGEDKESKGWTDSLRISTLDGSTTQSVSVMWLDGSIAWSPDSTRLAFVGLTGDYAYALYVMNADGSGLRELMVLNAGDESGEILPGTPAWSPDGARIAVGSFVSAAGAALLVVNADSGEQRPITSVAQGMITHIAWRPMR